MKIIVTCGPSYEPLDQVRRLTNFSTGRLGVTLANHLTRAGHEVVCFKGELAIYSGSLEAARQEAFSTNDDLACRLEDLGRSLRFDAVFHAAALCDYQVGSIKVDPQSHARIVQAGLAILEQGERLLTTVSPEIYATRMPLAFNASIGGHYRHCLDHFSSFVRGLDDGEVNYDRRDRDPRIENDPEHALRLTRQLRQILEALPPDVLTRLTAARGEVSYVAGESPVTESSLGRELAYVIAHAIHHYALITVMARLAGTWLADDFGIAPSTLAHQARQ